MAGGYANDAEDYFGWAKNSLSHAAIAHKGADEQWAILSGLGQIATGLVIMSGELKAIRKQLDAIASSRGAPAHRH
jgi:hypothetical protein